MIQVSRFFALVLLMFSLGSYAWSEESPYALGTIAEITPVRFESGDARPMFCRIRIESAASSVTFVLESKQSSTKKCESAWRIGDKIRFRVFGPDILIKQSGGSDLKARLAKSSE